MPLRPTRPMLGRANPGITRINRPGPTSAAMPAVPRPQKPLAPAGAAAGIGKTRSATASAFGKKTAATAKAGTLTGAGQAGAAKARGTIGPANPPKRTPVARRGKSFSIREPRQRGGS